MRCCCLCTALLAGLVLGSLGGLLARLAARIKLARQPRDAIKRSSKPALAKRLRSRLPNATSGRGKQRLRSGDTFVHRPKTHGCHLGLRRRADGLRHSALSRLTKRGGLCVAARARRQLPQPEPSNRTQLC